MPTPTFFLIPWVLPASIALSFFNPRLAGAGMMEGEMNPSNVVYGDHAGPLDFALFLQKAQGAGVQEEILLEARMIHAISSGNARLAAQVLPGAEKRASHFGEGPTVLGEEGFLANLHFLKAMQARESGDTEALKKHVCAAFLADPGDSEWIGSMLMEWRAEPPEPICLEMDRPHRLAGGGNATLREISNGRDRLLVLFSGKPESVADYAKLAADHNLGLVGVLCDSDLPENWSPTGPHSIPWILNAEDSPFPSQSPSEILLEASSGLVLYQGENLEPELETVLAELRTKTVSAK